ncbi:DeoR family transcriptional regulator [Marivivens niveibacter]|uniref:DeoR family transcriptional regulator n=1 Tax=Marivivens niveibacter TaxID=1930667 RepID=A0A251WYN1_9RHOB|nr:DeoR/GlpR family DNA-binding transcription regulator [Marivivens niveibacter]OUD09589.1 DeoR family transcriptional regulator [Marivivens niveibacter]
MKRDDRRQAIMDLLVQAGAVDLDDLAQRFDVSKMTIHRDLDDLEESGLLRKIRGGATIESGTQFEADYRYRALQNTDAKQAIAAKAASMVEPGMTILINDGTTAGLMADHLASIRPLTVITNNLAAIKTLSDQPGINLIALGGNFSQKFNAFFGMMTEDSLSRLRVDIGFLSAPAISGTTAYHMDENVTRCKRAMINASAHRVLLADKRKFGRTALHELADVSTFQTVITDTLDPEIAAPLRDAGVSIMES